MNYFMKHLLKIKIFVLSLGIYLILQLVERDYEGQVWQSPYWWQALVTFSIFGLSLWSALLVKKYIVKNRVKKQSRGIEI